MSKISAISALVNAHKGQFFSVTFQKKDGTMRTIKNAQVGFKKGHAGHNPVGHIEKYLTVIENKGGGDYQHRNVNMETVTKMSIAGVDFEFS